MARQARLLQMDLQGSGHTGCGEGPKTPPPSVVTTGERCPTVKSHPIRYAADMYAVTTRLAHVSRQTRSANTTISSLEARSVLPNYKIKY